MSEFHPHGPFSHDRYVLEIFSTQAARRGAVIRRKIRDIERYVGRDAFLREVQRRGYHAIENAGQFIVFCNLLFFATMNRSAFCFKDFSD